MKAAMLFCIYLIFPTLALSQSTWYVPDDFPAGIQAALSDVSVVNGDTVIVRSGYYTDNLDFQGKAITLRSEYGALFTFIDGSQSGSVVTFDQGEGPDTILQGFTIYNGLAPNGGGIRIYSSQPEVTECVLYWNEASDHGGGIFIQSATPVISDCTFEKNIASRGGGLFNQESSPNVTQCSFINNYANSTSSLGGGGMANYDSSPTVTLCIFQDNGAETNGGGMTNKASISHTSPTVTQCTFQGNYSFNGGGMFNSWSSPLITQCTFQDNRADINGEGGGIYNTTFSSPKVFRSIFQGNSAFYGAGMVSKSYSTPTIIQSTFHGNSAYVGGGFYTSSDSSFTIIQCTIYGNSAINGGGTCNESSEPMTLTNCILWNNTPDQIENFTAAVDVVSYSCIQGGYTGTGNIDTDPLFVDPDQQDFHLRQGSPCIDAGDNTAPGLPEFDLDGEDRIMDGNGDGIALVDMGIDECPALPAEIWVDDDWSGSSHGDWVEGHLFGTEAFDRIQDGLDMAAYTGKVHVADGTYTGEGNRDLDFIGKALTLKSENGPKACIIDCETLGRGFYFHNSEGVDSIVDGFTITNGYTSGDGGGMLIESSSPTVMNCVLLSNTADDDAGGMAIISQSSPEVMNCAFLENQSDDLGGGMCNLYDSSPLVIHCTFNDNVASEGGGMANWSNCSPVVTDCTFSGNTGNSAGGGMANTTNCLPVVTNCTFNNNMTYGDGGGMANKASCSSVVTHCTFYGNSGLFGTDGIFNSDSSPSVTNTILWNLEPDEFDNVGTSAPIVTYSCIQGGYAGEGNIDADPLFVNPSQGDLHLQYTSPCRDSGDNGAAALPTADYEGDPRIAEDFADMGADEFYLHFYCTGDFTPGGSVEGKIVGFPGFDPVILFFGTGLLESPVSTIYGDFFLELPMVYIDQLGPVPASGIILLPTTLPDPAASAYFLQTFIGDRLSNPFVLEVQ